MGLASGAWLRGQEVLKAWIQVHPHSGPTCVWTMQSPEAPSWRPLASRLRGQGGKPVTQDLKMIYNKRVTSFT